LVACLGEISITATISICHLQRLDFCRAAW
jgi:hypothetical protein